MSRLNPFQVCTMKFELRDKTEEFVQFIKDGDGINYGGQRNLADYEIMLQDLEIKSSVSNHSMAVVRVVFRRQTGFHGITTFAQTMVIILVAFISFFFNIRNFLSFRWLRISNFYAFRFCSRGNAENGGAVWNEIPQVRRSAEKRPLILHEESDQDLLHDSW